MRAFTLVELLVVMAIISILAAMLLPVLRETLATARAVACQNQQKQMLLGLRMYADDNEGFLPTYYDKSLPFPSDIPHWWHARVAWCGYLGGADSMGWRLLACPEPGAMQIGLQSAIFWGASDGNVKVPWQRDSLSGTCTYYNLDKTYRSSELFLMGDGRVEGSTQWGQYPGYPHAKGTNIGYADGHVRRFQYGTLPAHTWAGKLPYYNKKSYDPDAGISTSFWTP